MEKMNRNDKGGDKMNRAMRMVVFCMAVVVMLAGVSGAEEASWYDATENWIVRVYTAPAAGGYEVSLEVVDTGNNIVTDPIMGMASNPVDRKSTRLNSSHQKI